MALFEQFPYTNFHEMNLDWILNYVKGVKDKSDSIDQAVADAQAAQEAAEHAQGEAEAAKDDAEDIVEDFNTEVSAIKSAATNGIICFTPLLDAEVLADRTLNINPDTDPQTVTLSIPGLVMIMLPIPLHATPDHPEFTDWLAYNNSEFTAATNWKVISINLTDNAKRALYEVYPYTSGTSYYYKNNDNYYPVLLAVAYARGGSVCSDNTDLGGLEVFICRNNSTSAALSLNGGTLNDIYTPPID